MQENNRSRALTLVSNLLSDSMTVDALVAWPPLSTLNGSLLHMPITGAGGAGDGAGRPYPIRIGTAANCAGDADVVMYSGGEAALPMLAKARQQRQEPGGKRRE